MMIVSQESDDESDWIECVVCIVGASGMLALGILLIVYGTTVAHYFFGVLCTLVGAICWLLIFVLAAKKVRDVIMQKWRNCRASDPETTTTTV